MFRFMYIVSLLWFLTACGSSSKTYFYVLNTKQVSENLVGNDIEKVRIGVWRVKLPELIDRSEIINRTDLYNIELADFHQWAGGLSNNITQLIADELSRQLQSDQIVISPWASYHENNYQVKISINRFDGRLGGESVLRGAWSLLNAEGNKEIVREAFNYRALASVKSYSDMVKSQSKLIVQLADQISKSILAQKKNI